MFSFNHVTISVKDLDKTLNFYQCFGFIVINKYHDDNVDIVNLKLNNTILEVFNYKENNKLPDHSKDLSTDLKTIGNKHFGLGVKDINDAKNFVIKNNLFEGEINIVKGRLGKNYFFIKDPDDILMEIIEEN